MDVPLQEISVSLAARQTACDLRRTGGITAAAHSPRAFRRADARRLARWNAPRATLSRIRRLPPRALKLTAPYYPDAFSTPALFWQLAWRQRYAAPAAGASLVATPHHTFYCTYTCTFSFSHSSAAFFYLQRMITFRAHFYWTSSRPGGRGGRYSHCTAHTSYLLFGCSKCCSYLQQQSMGYGQQKTKMVKPLGRGAPGPTWLPLPHRPYPPYLLPRRTLPSPGIWDAQRPYAVAVESIHTLPAAHLTRLFTFPSF